ncbi:MAG: hypothetical protein ACK4NC_00105 [Candidatus Gracilibacteria bacterium]
MISTHYSPKFPEKRTYNNNYETLSAELTSLFSQDKIRALRKNYFINSDLGKNFDHLLRDEDEARLLKGYIFHNSKAKTNYILIKDKIADTIVLRPTQKGLKDKIAGSHSDEDVMDSSLTNAFKNLLVNKGYLSEENASNLNKESLVDYILAQYLKKYAKDQVHSIKRSVDFTMQNGKSWIDSALLKNEYKLVELPGPVEINNEYYFYANIAKEHLPKGENIWKSTLLTYDQITKMSKLTDVNLRNTLSKGLVIRINENGDMLDNTFELDTEKNTDGDYIAAVNSIFNILAQQAAASKVLQNPTHERENKEEVETTYDRKPSELIHIIKVNSQTNSAKELVERNVRNYISSKKGNNERKNWTENNSRTSSFNKIPQGYRLREALVINSEGKTANEVSSTIYPQNTPYRFVAENHGLITQAINESNSVDVIEHKIDEVMKNKAYIETYIKAQNIRTIISTVFSDLLKDFGIYQEGLTYPETVALQKNIFQYIDIIISYFGERADDKKFYDNWIIDFTPTNDQLSPAIDMIMKDLTADIMRSSISKDFIDLKPVVKRKIFKDFLTTLQ